ncbi:hypothetical protein GCM10027190_04250 [Spirosoma areae]
MLAKMNRKIWLWGGLSLAVLGYISTYLFLYSTKAQQTNRYRSRSLPTEFNLSSHRILRN